MATTAIKPDRRARPETRAAILGRAVDLASAEGLEGLTIGRLASDLEMSKSGVFRHFGSKEELQLATVAEASERFVRTVVQPALDLPEGAPRLRALCEGHISHLERQDYEGGCFWGATMSEFDDRPGPVRDAIRDAMGAWSNALAQQAKLAGVDDPDQLAFELVSLANGANGTYRLFGDKQAFTHARRAFERLVP